MANLDAQIRQIVQQELAKQNQRNSFNLNATPSHRHTGIGQDGPQINQSDIVPGQTARGLMTFASNTTYTLGVPFNPVSLFVYGNATHITGGTTDIRAFIIGDAKFSPSFYFQKANGTNNNSVTTGGKIYSGNPPPQKLSDGSYANTIIQSSAYFGASGGGSGTVSSLHTVADQFHLIDVEYPSLGTIVARADVISVSANTIIISVVLASGWSISANYIVT